MKYYKYLWVMVVLLMVACSSNSKKGAGSKEPKLEMQDSTLVKVGIQMEKTGGVYTLPCNVNGVKMNFILDTGASNVCISLTEALFLYKNGYLEDADIIGESLSQVADGSIVENMEINLHSIEVEGIIITDVKALVTKSIDAPLLLGQSAIQKLGKIEIKGDSLFIFRKGVRSTTSTITNEKRKDDVTSVESLPDPNFWDDVRAFFGSDCKIEKYLNKSQSAYNRGLTELAVKYANQAKDCDVDNWKPYVMIGFYASLAEDVKLQISVYEKYRKLNKHKETLYLLEGHDSLTYKGAMYDLSTAYLDLSRYDEAIQLAQEIIETHPTFLNIYHPMIISYCKLEQYDKAEKWAKKMLESDDIKAKSDGYFCLAYSALFQRKINDAIRYNEKAIELNPEYADAYWNLSICFSFLDYPDDNSYVLGLRKKSAKLGNKRAMTWLKEHGYSW